MPAYDDNPAVTGDYVWITADGTAGRRSRAAQVNAAKRAYERSHGVTLTLLARSYSETYGFLHRSAFRYEIGRPGQSFTITYMSVRCEVWDTEPGTYPTMAAAQAHVRSAFRTLSSYCRVRIHAPAGRQSQVGSRTGLGPWYFEPCPAGGRVTLRFPGFPPVTCAGPSITAIDA
jgi:hypothetical protein